jgi:hypothetical protein
MNKLSTERAIEILYTIRGYYASLTAGYPKGRDCKGIDDVMCSEIANSCLMAIKALEQESILDKIRAEIKEWYWQADKQALAKDPCVIDAMIDLFIRTIDKYKAESEDKG